MSEPIEIEEVDAHAAPDDVFARFHAIEDACHDELQPGEPVRSVEEVIAFYRYQPTTHTSCHWLADGGSASLYVHGPTAAFLQLLVVPVRRRRGLGSALLARVLQRAHQLDVTALRGSYATGSGAAFAAHVGAVAEDRVVRSVLDLRTAELPEPREGFRLITWLARVPDEHLSAYVEARAAMDDAPSPEGMEVQVEVVSTSNAEKNSVMRHLNESIGFRPTATVTGAVLELRQPGQRGSHAL